MNHTTTLAAMLVLSALIAPAWGGQPPEKCGGADIANGPFTYAVSGATSATFVGEVSGAIATGFTITAPSPKVDTIAPNVFAGQGATNECAQTAIADIGVIEILKVADANGESIDPVNIGLDTSPGQQVKDAIKVNPDFWDNFYPGDSEVVAIDVGNPNLAPADYGTYDIKIAAKADGYGIGVGSGLIFSLTLEAPTAVDSVKPIVQINSPIGPQILGVIPVEVEAWDQDLPGASGLASVSASIKSAGGGVPEHAISLTPDKTLPVNAGIHVTGTGSYAPRGGSESDVSGTSDTDAFHAGFKSGIGTYTLKAIAKDVAGNEATADQTFTVNYAVEINTQSTCANNAGNANCQGKFDFSVNRSAITSDGNFMFDKTVRVDLVTVAAPSTVVKSHYYAAGGDPKDVVQIDSSAEPYIYKTAFKRGDIGGTVKTAYLIKIYFTDVDGNSVLQATSSSLSF